MKDKARRRISMDQDSTPPRRRRRRRRRGEIKRPRPDMGYKRCKGNIINNDVKFTNRRDDGIENGDIPEWLLVEVLIRLSPKIVCTFKLVSTQWFSIITDPSFIRAYISRASSVLSPQPWTFISHSMHQHQHHQGYNKNNSHFPELGDVYSQIVKPSYCVLSLPCTQQQSHGGKKHCEIFAVSDGLVLYGLSVLNREAPFDFMHSYYICNPVTRLWIALPIFSSHVFAKVWGFLTHVEDGVLKSYTVVRLKSTRTRNLLTFEVFYSEIGEWKNYNVFNALQILFYSRRQATAVNGVLHWIASEVGIIAYDPYKSPEQVRVIAFPDDILNRQGEDPYNSLCAEYKGKLRYFEASFMYMSGNPFPSFKLWVLNDHISGGWSLQHKISYMDIQCDPNICFKESLLAPLSFHPFDLDVVYFGWMDALVSYNIKTKKLEVQQKCCRQNEITPKLSPEWWWAFLLVIPSWPISVHCLSSGAAES